MYSARLSQAYSMSKLVFASPPDLDSFFDRLLPRACSKAILNFPEEHGLPPFLINGGAPGDAAPATITAAAATRTTSGKNTQFTGGSIMARRSAACTPASPSTVSPANLNNFT